jgi:phosphatidylinositol dimannoside acyltransferase
MARTYEATLVSLTRRQLPLTDGVSKELVASADWKTRLSAAAITKAYQVGAVGARALPQGVANGAAKLLAIGLRHGLGERRAMVARHQQRLGGGTLTAAQLDAQVAKAFDSYAQYWVDSFRLTGRTTAEVDAGFRVDGAQYVDEALALGKGAILAMPHIGAWDYGGAWVAHHWPLTVVAERLEPPELFDWFCQQRQANHLKMVALGPEAGPVLLSALRKNELIGLLCDRDIAGGGIEAEFFGERTTFPAGPATLSLRTGAVILPNAVFQEGNLAHGIIRPPLQFERSSKLRADISALTQLLVSELEALIRMAPEQWHVLQPVWPSDSGQ